MRHLDAAGARVFRDLDDTFETLLGQMPLAEQSTGGRCTPKAARILIANRIGDQRKQGVAGSFGGDCQLADTRGLQLSSVGCRHGACRDR